MSNDHSHHAHHVAEAAKHLFEIAPHISEKKNPVIAGIVGFFFGGVGLGIYLGTWQDCVFPILIFLGMSIVMPGIGSLAALFVVSAWGVKRASHSG